MKEKSHHYQRRAAGHFVVAIAVVPCCAAAYSGVSTVTEEISRQIFWSVRKYLTHVFDVPIKATVGLTRENDFLGPVAKIAD